MILCSIGIPCDQSVCANIWNGGNCCPGSCIFMVSSNYDDLTVKQTRKHSSENRVVYLVVPEGAWANQETLFLSYVSRRWTNQETLFPSHIFRRWANQETLFPGYVSRRWANQETLFPNQISNDYCIFGHFFFVLG